MGVHFSNSEDIKFAKSTNLVDTLLKLKEFFESKLPEQYSVVYDELAKVGWYMDYHLSPKTLADLILLDYKNMSHLNQHMIKYFQKEYPAISKKIQTLYPERKNIINAAFKAHKRAEYELSIPVFLTQIDGICYDLTQKDFFTISARSETKKEQPKHWVIEQRITNFKKSILTPLNKNEYLSVQIKNRYLYPQALNRNEILHGRTLDYATEVNSLKAISLLNYMSIIVADIKYEREMTLK